MTELTVRRQNRRTHYAYSPLIAQPKLRARAFAGARNAERMAQNWAWFVVALLICGAIVHRAHQQTPGCLEASRLLEVENTLYSKLERALVPMRQENTALRAELAALRAAAPVAAARAATPRRDALPVSVAAPALERAPALARTPAPLPEPPAEVPPPRRRLSPEEASRVCRAAAQRRGAKALKHKAELFGPGQVAKAMAACEAGQRAARTVPPPAVPPLLLLPPPEETGQRYLLLDRAFCHGLGHEALVYNVALRLASRLRLTLVHVPLLSHKAHGPTAATLPPRTLTHTPAAAPAPAPARHRPRARRTATTPSCAARRRRRRRCSAWAARPRP